MAPSPSSEIAWSELVDAAVTMFNENNDAGCVVILRALLLDSRAPGFWRIQARVILAKATVNWYEAQHYRRTAELLWKFLRKLLPVKQDDEFDQTMNLNRICLDELAIELDDVMPDDERAFRESVDDEDTNSPDDGDDSADDGGSDDGEEEVGRSEEEEEEEEESDVGEIEEVKTPATSQDRLSDNNMSPHNSAAGSTDTADYESSDKFSNEQGY